MERREWMYPETQLTMRLADIRIFLRDWLELAIGCGGEGTKRGRERDITRAYYGGPCRVSVLSVRVFAYLFVLLILRLFFPIFHFLLFLMGCGLFFLPFSSFFMI